MESTLISLREWAEQVGIDPATARQKAIRGAIPAYKIGSQWVISKGAPNTDHRQKKLSHL